MKHCKQAFTLIELLVVICIIAILASMLLPALQSARESASTATCISNLGQFAKAFQMYATGYNDYMPALTDPQGSSGKTGWECALVEAIGQNPAKNAPFKKSFFCDADGSSDDVTDSKKSYSLNNLQEAIHPRLLNMLDYKGKLTTLKDAKKAGYISGNKTTSVFTASDLIIIGENASESNKVTWSSGYGEAKFVSSASGDPNSPGSASAVQQYWAIKRRNSSHTSTAGELYLDGHAKHIRPQQTLPTNTTFNLSGTRQYSDSYAKASASTAWGSWTDCKYRKVGDNCTDDTTCRKK